MKAPAFQFYVSDWVASQRVTMLSLAEEGAFLRLLCSAWLAGSVPSDPAMAARIIGKDCPPATAQAALAMFIPAKESGRMVNERQEEERAKQIAFRKACSAAGKKGGGRPVKGTFNQPKTGVKGSIYSPSPTPSPTPSPSASSYSTHTPNPPAGASAPEPPDGVADKCPLQVRVTKLFHRRRLSTPWSTAELRAWKNAKAIVADASAADWQALEAWFSLPAAPYRRQGLAALLNNWSDEIGRAQLPENLTLIAKRSDAAAEALSQKMRSAF